MGPTAGCFFSCVYKRRGLQAQGLPGWHVGTFEHHDHPGATCGAAYSLQKPLHAWCKAIVPEKDAPQEYEAIEPEALPSLALYSEAQESQHWQCAEGVQTENT